MLTWKELKYNDKFKEVIFAVYDDDKEVTTCQIDWYRIWEYYDPLFDGTPEDYVKDKNYKGIIIDALEREDYYDDEDNVSGLANDIVTHYMPQIMKNKPKILYQLTYKNRSLPYCFLSDKMFIDFTLEWAENEALIGDQYSIMSGWGFKEIIDKKRFDKDGELIECESHWEADVKTCVDFWKKAMHWKVTKI